MRFFPSLYEINECIVQVFDIFLDLNQVAIQLWFHPSTASSKCMNCNQKVFIYIKTTKVEHPPFPMWLGLEPRQSEKKQASLQKAMFNTRKSNVENLGREEKKKKFGTARKARRGERVLSSC